MKSTFFASVLLLGTMASPAMAQNGDVSPAKGGPVMLSVAQMDAVTAGQGCSAVIGCDAIDINNNEVAVAVNASAAVAVLGNARSRAEQNAPINQ